MLLTTFRKRIIQVTGHQQTTAIKASFILCWSESGQNSITAELYTATEQDFTHNMPQLQPSKNQWFLLIA